MPLAISSTRVRDCVWLTGPPQPRVSRPSIVPESHAARDAPAATVTPATTGRSKDETALLDHASRWLPGGMLGGARFPENLAFVVKRGRGSKIWDVSGREYIDYLLGSG